MPPSYSGNGKRWRVQTHLFTSMIEVWLVRSFLEFNTWEVDKCCQWILHNWGYTICYVDLILL